MSRLSTLATSTLMPALKVLSTTLPVSTFLSLVRTNAPPLPGLTCWNSTTLQSPPSMSSVMPFLRSFVVATAGLLEDQQVPGRRREDVGSAWPDHERVLDPYPAAPRQVDAGLHGDGHPLGE